MAYDKRQYRSCMWKHGPTDFTYSAGTNKSGPDCGAICDTLGDDCKGYNSRSSISSISYACELFMSSDDDDRLAVSQNNVDSFGVECNIKDKINIKDNMNEIVNEVDSKCEDMTDRYQSCSLYTLDHCAADPPHTPTGVKYWCNKHCCDLETQEELRQGIANIPPSSPQQTPPTQPQPTGNICDEDKLLTFEECRDYAKNKGGVDVERRDWLPSGCYEWESSPGVIHFNPSTKGKSYEGVKPICKGDVGTTPPTAYITQETEVHCDTNHGIIKKTECRQFAEQESEFYFRDWDVPDGPPGCFRMSEFISFNDPYKVYTGSGLEWNSICHSTPRDKEDIPLYKLGTYNENSEAICHAPYEHIAGPSDEGLCYEASLNMQVDGIDPGYIEPAYAKQGDAPGCSWWGGDKNIRFKTYPNADYVRNDTILASRPICLHEGRKNPTWFAAWRRGAL